MEAGLVTASEAIKFLNVTPERFIRLQELGCFRPVVSGGRWVLYEAESLPKGLIKIRPKDFPTDRYATVKQALGILDISRATFYKKVKRGEIQLHPYRGTSFVKLADLYAGAELF